MLGHDTRSRWTTFWIQIILSTSEAILRSSKDHRMRRIFSRLNGRVNNIESGEDDFGVCTTREMTLEVPPQDILLQILSYIDVQGVLRIAKVCRALQNLASTRDVWRYQAAQLMAIGRPLVFSGFSTLSDLSTQELKLAVIRTSVLKERWYWGSQESCSFDPYSRGILGHSHEAKIKVAPGALQALYSDKISLALSVPLCLSSYHIVKFKRFLLLPTRGDLLVVWDIEAKQSLGVYDMKHGFLRDTEETGRTAPVGAGMARPSGLIFSGWVHYSSRSVYYIVSGGFIAGQEMQFYILRIQLPSGTDSESDDRIQFTHIAGFTLPFAYIIEMHVLDVKRRMVCMVLLCPSSNMLYLYVVFDWDTKESAIVDTGFGYQYKQTVVSLHLSAEDDIVLRLEGEGYEVIRLFSLTSLRQPSSTSDCTSAPSRLSSAAPFPAISTLLASQSIVLPVRGSQISWSDDASRSLPPPFPNPDLLGPGPQAAAETFAYCVWNILPWWPTFEKVPYRISTVVLYCIDSSAPGEKSWKIAQHFATDRGPCPISAPTFPTRPCHGVPSEYAIGSSSASVKQEDTGATIESEEQGVYKRCIIPLRDPAMVPFSDEHVPILGLDYNHVVWIEQIDIRRYGRRIKRRVAMLASFPEPGAGSPQLCSSSGWGEKTQEGLKSNIRALSIPEHVLDGAYHLIVDSSCATVLVTTRGNELYNYRYA